MGMNIYVGNLSYKVSSTDLQAIFEPFGTVENAKVVNDRDTGRSKGFGFVEMENADEGQKAIDALNGKEVQGRALKVSQANPPQRDRGDRGDRGGDRGDRGGDRGDRGDRGDHRGDRGDYRGDRNDRGDRGDRGRRRDRNSR